MNLGAALLALTIALLLKLLVMVFGGRLLYRFFRSRFVSRPKRQWILLPERNSAEVRLLFWALIFFYLSEITCGIEIYVIFRSSPWLSGTHAFASAIGMALFVMGLWEHIDRELLRFGQPSCLLNRICKGCTIGGPPGCKFNTLALLVAAFVVLASLPPFLASTDQMVADPRRWLLPFPTLLNDWYDQSLQPWLRSRFPDMDLSGGAYYIYRVINVIEYRVLPAAALLLALAGLALQRLGRQRHGFILSAAASGVLGYVYLELVTTRLHGDALAGGVMHEVAEFWFLVVTAEYLMRAFGPRPASPERAPDVS